MVDFMSWQKIRRNTFQETDIIKGGGAKTNIDLRYVCSKANGLCSSQIANTVVILKLYVIQSTF